MCIVWVILRQLLALPCKLLLVYAIFSLCRGTIGEKCTTEWVQSTYTTSAWTFLVCWDVSVHFCFGFFLLLTLCCWTQTIQLPPSCTAFEFRTRPTQVHILNWQWWLCNPTFTCARHYCAYAYFLVYLEQWTLWIARSIGWYMVTEKCDEYKATQY